MYEKLSPHLDRVIKMSQRIARDYDQDYVGTEHLFLAILEEDSGVAVAILNDNGIDLKRAREAVDRLVRKSLEDTWVFGRLPGTPHFRNVLSRAIEEARGFGSKVVDSEHMLLALSCEDGSVAQNALTELGLNTKSIRAEIKRRLTDSPAQPRSESA
jgi:ATP-dependent Clp protease ATP-binding subunit ClpC